MIFDPVYFLFVGPAMLLAFGAQWMTKSAFNKYSKVRSARNITGAQAAKIMLDGAGVHDVKIVSTRGFLSDHYNPVTKTLALSEPNYNVPSVAAIGIACHEAGHAIQHARNYAPLWLRSALVPTVGIGSTILNHATIGANSIVGANSLVTEHKSFPDGVLTAMHDVSRAVVTR